GPKVRFCPSAPMLSSKLSRCKGARDNALHNDEGCDRITLGNAQSVAALACGSCCSAHDCRSRACACAEHRHRRLRRLSAKIRYLRDVEASGGAACDLQG